MGIEIRHALEPVTAAQLEALEARVGFALPADYRDSLLRHNGGIPRPDGFRLPDEASGTLRASKPPISRLLSGLMGLPTERSAEDGEVLWLLPIGRTGILDPMRLDFEAALAKLRVAGSTLPTHLIPVAEAHTNSNPGILSDYLCISIEGPDRGHVYLWRDIEGYRFETPVRAADSWNAFLASLHHRFGAPPKWLTMIQDNDIVGLERLLDKVGGLKVTDPFGLSALDHAVAEGRWEIVQKLLERGASATDAFEQALDQRRYPLARQLLAHGIKSRTIQKALTPPWRQFFWTDLDLVRALIDAGADVNHVDKEISNRNTPVHSAADAGVVEAVRLLLEHGARPEVRNGDGKLAQELAEEAGHPEVAKLLAEAPERPRPRKRRPAPGAPVKELDLHGVQIRRSGPALTEAVLAALENKLGIFLPADYRAFLLQHNGGIPRPNRFRYVCDDSDSTAPEFESATLERFYPATGPGRSPTDTTTLETAYQPAGKWAPDARLVPIGEVDDDHSGGVLCISVDGKDRCQVYYVPAEEDAGDTLYEVTQSFSDFLALLGAKKTTRPAWVTAIEDGDLSAVQKWLDEGGSQASEYRHRNPLTTAVGEGQLDIVKLLLARGASATEAFAHAVDAARPAILRFLLESGAVPTVDKDTFVSYQGPDWQGALWRDGVLVKAFADRGADVDFCGEDGVTPLYLAAQYGSAAVLQFLLQRGARAGVWSKNMGHTALHRAVFTEDREELVAKMKLLIDAGEDLHARQRRQTPVPPQDLMAQAFKNLGPVGASMAQMFESVTRQILHPELSAADLLAQHKGKAVLHELEAYAASRSK